MKLLFPGSFDPITLGHMDLIERAAQIADELHVVSFDNAAKRYLLSKEERLMLMQKATVHLGNVIVDSSDGMQVAYCREHGIGCVLRGLRNEMDLLYERDIAAANRQLGGLETLFLISAPSVAHISSSVVRELVAFSADLTGFVPECVREYIQKLTH